MAQIEECLASIRPWADSGLVFTNQTGGPLYGPHLTRHLRRILNGAGLPRVTFRELRHTGATALLAMGAELTVIQDLLGHTSIAMTRRYAQVVEPLKREAADRMDDFLSGSGRDLGRDRDLESGTPTR